MRVILLAGLISVMGLMQYVLATNSSDMPPKPILGLGPEESFHAILYAVYNVDSSKYDYTCVSMGSEDYTEPVDTSKYKAVGCEYLSIGLFKDRWLSNNLDAVSIQFNTMKNTYYAIKAVAKGNPAQVVYSDPRYANYPISEKPHAKISLQSSNATQMIIAVNDYTPRYDAYGTVYSCVTTNMVGSIDPADYTDINCNLTKIKDKLSVTVDRANIINGRYFALKVSGFGWAPDPTHKVNMIPTNMTIFSNIIPITCEAPIPADFSNFLLKDDVDHPNNYQISFLFKSTRTSTTSPVTFDYADQQPDKLVTTKLPDNSYNITDHLISKNDPNTSYLYKVYNKCENDQLSKSACEIVFNRDTGKPVSICGIKQ
ncbi:MAG: hypothetical protein K0R14_1636 [Burkholderiales bacterium]|jgi:hypothetical protein|nr:hypothetical protein [Burkholderiales bacterium]